MYLFVFLHKNVSYKSQLTLEALNFHIPYYEVCKHLNISLLLNIYVARNSDSSIYSFLRYSWLINRFDSIEEGETQYLYRPISVERDVHYIVQCGISLARPRPHHVNHHHMTSFLSSDWC